MLYYIYGKIKKRYPSDLSDEECKIIKPSVELGRCGIPCKANTREVVNAILYITKTDVNGNIYQKIFLPGILLVDILTDGRFKIYEKK